jgi:ribonuclease BN (tRNA processing enzyme)
MRQKGVSLSEKGQLDEAITWYDKALEVNPRDYNAMRNRGVSLTNQGQLDEAITWLKKALEFPEGRKDGYAFYALAVACQRAGRIEEAVQVLAEILDKPGQFPTIVPLARRLRALIEADLPEKSLSSEDRVVLEVRRPEYATGPEERIRAKIESAEQTVYDDYMERKPSKRDNVVSILRGWSSAVTLLEGTEQLWRGGGYFVKWAGKGIVIDPGFDFLRNFHDEEYHAREIAAVLVSHNHSDHNADLKNVDDLRYELYKRRGKDEAKRVDPYVLIWDADTQASTRFSIEEPKHQFRPILFDVGRCNPCDTIESPHSLPMSLEYFPVRHTGAVSNPVGFKLHLIGADGHSFTLGYTGDTEFFPELVDQLSGCNLLIAHISQPDPDELSDPSVRKRNHLGYRGLVDLIKGCNPETTIVSEFWAGLADIRIDLVQGIRRLANTQSILPGGIGMHVHIPELQVECTQCERKVPFVDVRVSPPAAQFGHLAYLCSECVLG